MVYTYGKEYHKIMANITIVKLKVRRGTDSQRQEIVLDQGEVGYTLDSKRLFVGDGATYGGTVAGNVNVGPFASTASLGPAAAESPYLQVGDIGYADSRLFILTGTGGTGKKYTNGLSGWAYIGNVPDDSFIEFDTDNKLTIKKQSLDSQYIGTTFFGDGLLSSNTVPGRTNVGLNTDYLFLCGPPDRDQLISLKEKAITPREISDTAVLSGLQGGDGTPLSLIVNEKQFRFGVNNRLEFGSAQGLTLPVSSWAGPGDGRSETEGHLGEGLQVNTDTHRLETILQGANEDFFNVNDGILTLNGSQSAAYEMPFVDVQNGLVTEINTSVFDVVTATGLSGTGAGDGVPIGSILPHAQAFNHPPAGYLLCDGSVLDADTRPEYRKLYDKIGTVYGGSGRTDFKIPSLTGGDVMIYGADGAITTGTKTLWLSGTQYGTGGKTGGAGSASVGTSISASGVNFIIKYKEDPVLNIFNGAPNQVTNKFGSKYDQQIYYGKDSGGNEMLLSSAGFITLALSGTVRNPENTDNNIFNKFAIPVFSY